MESRAKFRWHDTFIGAGGGVLLIVLLLMVIGIAFIHSASYRPQLHRHLPYASKQFLWMFIGLVLFFVLLAVDYTTLLKYAYIIYFLGLLGLLATAVIGITNNSGSRRWIRIGPVLLQTSEFMKLALILVLAKCLRYKNSPLRWSDLVWPFLLTLIPMGLILKQPDLGTALVFMPILFAMLFVCGIPVKYLIIIFLVLLHAIPFGFFFLHEYQRNRILVFLYQGNLTREQRRKEGYHLIMSKISLGSGGAMGKGLGQGTQNRGGFLPARHTDFIFAVIGEEWGFVGTACVLGIFLCLILLMLAIAQGTREPGGRLIVTGIATLFAVQVLVNTAMTMGFAPITGLPLPFLSYGGSSLLFAFIGLSLVVGVLGRKVAFLEHGSGGAGGILQQ